MNVEKIEQLLAEMTVEDLCGQLLNYNVPGSMPLEELEEFVQHFLLTYLALVVEVVAAVVLAALVVVLADFVAFVPLAFVLLVFALAADFVVVAAAVAVVASNV